jgi:hypothetical protein
VTPPASTVITGRAIAEKQIPPGSGVLNLCLVSGAGLTSGQSFTSAFTLGGVTRSLTNTTGNCTNLEIPRESTPQGKGWFQTRPAEVERTLPGTTKLQVDGAQLSRADVLAVLNAAPNVQPSTSLVLNLAQQLIAAELNVLRGVQVNAAVKQAIIDANAALEVTVGAQIVIGTSLANAPASALVATLAGFNEGKTKPPVSPVSVDIDVVQAAVKNLEIAAIACVPSTSCTGSDLALGRITTTVRSGVETKVSYTNQSKPILRLCVVGAEGLPAITSQFEGVAPGVGFLDFSVPTGQCREAETPENVGYELTRKTTTAGVRLASIACEASTMCSTTSLEDQTVTAFVNRGVTTVTYTLRNALGTIKMCKVTSGLPTDKQYTFDAFNEFIKNLPGEPIVATVKLASGDCVEKTLLEGKGYRVAELDELIGAKLSITCDPALRCDGLDALHQSTNADIVAGSTTTVTFTNTTTLGILKLCVQNGGVPATSAFMIEVSPWGVFGTPGEPTSASPMVGQGQCHEVTLVEGPYVVAMSPSGPGFFVDFLTCSPTARCFDTFPSSTKADVVASSTTTVTFTMSFAESRVAPKRPGVVRSP